MTEEFGRLEFGEIAETNEDVQSLLEKVNVRLLGYMVRSLDNAGPDPLEEYSLRVMVSLAQIYQWINPHVVQQVGGVSIKGND